MALALVLAAAGPAAARDTPARKLGRSLSNITLGVLAVPGHVVETTRERGPFMGATWGLVKGVAYMTATEVVGVFELVTAPFAVPPEFKPILRPEFPWQYFTEEGRRQMRESSRPRPATRRTR